MDGETIYSVYDASGTLVYRDNVTSGKATDHIALPGMGGIRNEHSGGSSTVTYIYKDHLGSVSMGANTAGNVIWRETYTPFGEDLIWDPVQNRDTPGFTGHIEDHASGLTYMQARYYDPVIGRFLSIDPVGFTPKAPYMFNRYAYVGNDPVNETDPTGQCPWCIAGAIIGGGIQLASEINNGNINLKDGFSKENLQAAGRVTLAAGAGALGGGIGTVAGRVIVGNTGKAIAGRAATNAVGGAAVGAGQATGNAAIEGRAPTHSELVTGAALGGALSGGGSLAGDAIGAGISSIGRGARNAADEAAINDAMVQGSQMPAGMQLDEPLHAASTPHVGSVAGATIGNAVGNGVANSGPLIDELRD